ncbi:hypothetical protein COCOBI_05-1680 [Coccomyxa sp. Obi]|nr:hypothetical protein COCOBI_05-1680 [Coccomyxa sp. Obi]
MIAIFSVPLPAVGTTDSKATCTDLGFTGLQPCSACDTLRQYLDDKELVEDCQRCCTPEADTGSGKYLSAVLEVCKHRLREFPTVEHFVKDMADDIDNLEVRYRFGSSPRLILVGENGKKETLRIDKWKTELIVEYLEDKLAVSTAGA